MRTDNFFLILYQTGFYLLLLKVVLVFSSQNQAVVERLDEQIEELDVKPSKITITPWKPCGNNINLQIPDSYEKVPDPKCCFLSLPISWYDAGPVWVSVAAGQPYVSWECVDTPLLPRPSQRPTVETASDADTPLRGVYRTEKAELGIRDILGTEPDPRIRDIFCTDPDPCIHTTHGSGSGASSFHQWLSKFLTKRKGFFQVF